jgi:hypothetical protein
MRYSNVVQKKISLVDLDECVIRALYFLEHAKLPDIPYNEFSRPLVVGSGNAAVTGQILFRHKDAIFADESDYETMLKNTQNIDGCFLISASGGKHAPIIARALQERNIKTILITNNENARACSFASECKVFPKNIEPYTYNVSTYLSMILSKTHEKPEIILKHLSAIEKKIPKTLKRYDSFYFIIPEKFIITRDMLITKFDELFGSKISVRIYTLEQTKHAKTIVPNEKELFVSFGMSNNTFGKNRLFLPVPQAFDYAGFIALTYFLIGKIQAQNQPYFKKNIEEYIKKSSKVFGEKIEALVK